MGGDGDGPPTCHAWLTRGLWPCQAAADSSPGSGERGLGGKSCFSEHPLPGGRVQDPSTPPPNFHLLSPARLGRRCPPTGAGRGQPARPGDPGDAGGSSGDPPGRRQRRGAGTATERRPRVLPVGQPAAVAVAAASPGPALARTRTALRRQQPRVLTARGGNKGADPGVPVSVSVSVPFPVPGYGWEWIPAPGGLLHPQHGRSIAPTFLPAAARNRSCLQHARTGPRTRWGGL